MTAESAGDPLRGVRSYVLRGGRLSKGQQRALDVLYNTYCIPFRDRELDISEVCESANPERGTQEIVVEIGFGTGDATAQIAEEHPGTIYVGIDVFLAGIGGLLNQIERRELNNVRIVRHDAVEVVRNMIPDGWISGFHVFFPDPWPKKKHHKRRLMQPEFVALLCTKLKIGGYIYAVTDWEEYAEEMRSVLSATHGLSNPNEAATDDGYAPPLAWRPGTKFEKKGLDKRHRIRELFFVKTTV